MAALDVAGGAGDRLRATEEEEGGADEVGGVAERLAAAWPDDPGGPWNGGPPPGPPGEAP